MANQDNAHSLLVTENRRDSRMLSDYTTQRQTEGQWDSEWDEGQPDRVSAGRTRQAVIWQLLISAKFSHCKGAGRVQ